MVFREEKHQKSDGVEEGHFSPERVVNMGAGLPSLGEVIRQEVVKTRKNCV